MPLSEEELRLLEQMERALAAEDPKFVSTIQGHALEKTARLRAVGAAVVFLVGIGLLLGGAMSELIWLSIIGFVIMLGSAIVGLTAWRGRHAPRQEDPSALFDAGPEAAKPSPDQSRGFQVLDGGKQNRPAKRPKPRKQGTFMQRMEMRWQRRRDEGY